MVQKTRGRMRRGLDMRRECTHAADSMSRRTEAGCERVCYFSKGGAGECNSASVGRASAPIRGTALRQRPTPPRAGLAWGRGEDAADEWLALLGAGDDADGNVLAFSDAVPALLIG